MMIKKNTYEKDEMIKNQEWVFKNEKNEVLVIKSSKKVNQIVNIRLKKTSVLQTEIIPIELNLDK